MAEHHRKARKLAKSSTQWKSKKPKDLGIPNAFPFKEQVLAEREEIMRRREEEKRKKRTGGETESAEHVNQREPSNGGENGGETGFVAGLQIDSDEEEVWDEDMSDDEEESDEEVGESVDEEDLLEEEDDENESMGEVESSDSEWEGIDSDENISDIDAVTQTNTSRNSKKPDYLRAILRSDLVLFVLDARAINVTRSPEVEEYAGRKAKESFFVLNRGGTYSYILRSLTNRTITSRNSAGLDRTAWPNVPSIPHLRWNLEILT